MASSLSSHIRPQSDLNLALPAGARVTATEGFNVSYWAKTGRIDTQIPSGPPQSFFIKVVSGAVGKAMVVGEFESMSAIHAVAPEFVPRPVAWGQYADVPATYFFLCAYRSMKSDMPDPVQFTALLGKVHHQSESPSGRFGFHVPTYPGNLPQYVEQEDSWEIFFAKSMRQALDLEISRKGSSEELDGLAEVLFGKVIPRLLRPLESEGRSVRPSLVHGDLWYANSGIDTHTGQILVFDACCFYAHHECESGPCVGDGVVALTLQKTSLGNGVRSAINSEKSISRHTTHITPYQSRKKTSLGAWTFTDCKSNRDANFIEAADRIGGSTLMCLRSLSKIAS